VPDEPARRGPDDGGALGGDSQAAARAAHPPRAAGEGVTVRRSWWTASACQAALRSSPRKRGPIRRRLSRGHGVMGPCFRRDDAEWLARAAESQPARRIFLTPGALALFGGLAAVISPKNAGRSAAFVFRGFRRAGTRLESLVGEDGHAPERPLAIGEGLGDSRYRPQESPGGRGGAGCCGRARRSLCAPQRGALRRRAPDRRPARSRRPR